MAQNAEEEYAMGDNSDNPLNNVRMEIDSPNPEYNPPPQNQKDVQQIEAELNKSWLSRLCSLLRSPGD